MDAIEIVPDLRQYFELYSARPARERDDQAWSRAGSVGAVGKRETERLFEDLRWEGGEWDETEKRLAVTGMKF